MLHVVDTPITRVLGSETADRESGADERYLSDVIAALKRPGFQGPRGPAAWPRSGGRDHQPICGRIPVDLLVVGSHGHGMVRDLLLGQTVDKVRHSLGVPMLIARPDRAAASAASAHDIPTTHAEGPV